VPTLLKKAITHRLSGPASIISTTSICSPGAEHTIWAHDTRRARTSAALGRYRSTPMHWIDAFNVTLRMFDMRFWPDCHLIKWTSPSFGVTFPTLIGKLVNAALTWSLRLSKAYPLSGWRCESNRFLLKKNKADLVKPGRYKPLRCSRFNSVMKTLISPFSLQCW